MGKGHSKPGDAKKMLSVIDDNPENCEKTLDTLFSKFDKDKSGFLEGAEFEGLKNEVKGYAKAEFDKKYKDLPNPYTDEMLDQWVSAWMDPSGDKKCSKDEMIAGLKVIVNYND